MEAKEIVDNISKTPWSVGSKSVNAHGVHCQGIDASNDVTEIITVNGMTDSLYPYSGLADITATISAVNNTYGKGLNPEVYEDVVKLLENLKRVEDLHREKGNSYLSYIEYNAIEQTIKQARI